MAKFDKQSFSQKYFFFMHMLSISIIFLHAHAQCIYIVSAKYQKASVKALVQVDFPVYALSKHKQNSYLKATSSCKCSMCHIV